MQQIDHAMFAVFSMTQNSGLHRRKREHVAGRTVTVSTSATLCLEVILYVGFMITTSGE